MRAMLRVFLLMLVLILTLSCGKDEVVGQEVVVPPPPPIDMPQGSTMKIIVGSTTFPATLVESQPVEAFRRLTPLRLNRRDVNSTG